VLRVVQLWLVLLLAALSPASARLLHFTGGSPTAGQSIASVSPSTGSYTSGASSGTVIAAVAVTLSPMSPLFTGTLSLTGTAAADFSLSSTTLPANLTTNGSTPTCGSTTTLNLNIVATQAGLGGSPYTQAVVVTCSPPAAQTFVTPAPSLSNTTFTGGLGTGTIVGQITAPMSPASPATTGTVVLATTGATCNGTNGANNADFQVAGSAPSWNLELATTLAAGTYQVCLSISQAGISNSPQQQAFTITGGTFVETNSFFNNSGSASPSGVTPVNSGVYFPKGAVPSGCHADPSIGGVTLAQWSASDFADTWEDGSTRFFSFSGFKPTNIASDTYSTVSWTLDCSGGWPSVTGGSLSTDFSGTDFKVKLTDVTTAYVPVNNITQGMLAGIVVPSGSGAVSSGVINDNPILGFNCGGGGSNCGGLTVTVQGCSGTAPVLSFTSYVNGSGVTWPNGVVVNTPGSGCPTVGSGTFYFDLGAIFSGTTSVPLCTNLGATTSQVCQYAGDSVKNGYQVWGYPVDAGLSAWAASTPYTTSSTVSSLGNAYQPNANCTSGSTAPVGVGTAISDGSCSWKTVIQPVWFHAIVEAWKNSGGGIWGYSVAIESDNAVYSAGGTIQNWTFNADLLNNSTELYGAANGNTGYTGINMVASGGAWWFVDTAGLPFWVVGGSLSSSTAYNNVVASLTTSDKTYMHASHILPPLQQITMVSNTLPATDDHDWMGATFMACPYVPYSFDCNDDVSDSGQAGDHGWLGAETTVNAWHYEVEDTAPDGGASFAQSGRVGALGNDGQIGGPREPLTSNPVNWIPNGASGWTKPGRFTDPVRPNAGMGSTVGPPTQFDMAWGLDEPYGGSGGGAFDVQHFGNFAIYPYITEGRRYMLFELDFNGTLVDMNIYAPQARNVAFNGNTYYTEGPVQGSVRASAWGMHAFEPVALFDYNEPDGQMAYYKTVQAWDAYAAWFPYVGSGTAGTTSPTAISKGYSMTANGLYIPFIGYTTPLSPPAPYGGIMQEFFTEGYADLEIENEYMHLGGAIPALVTVADAVFNNFAMPDLSQCIYNAFVYVFPTFVSTTTLQPLTSWDATTLQAGNAYIQYNRNGNALNYEAGSDVFLAGYTANTAEGWWAFPVASSSGSTITVNSNTDNGTVVQATTSATSASNVLNFSGGPAFSDNAQYVFDLTNPSAIPSGTRVSAVGTTTVTISNTVTVASGDLINFYNPGGTATIIDGSEVYDLTTPANVPWGTYVTGSTGLTGLTLSGSVTMPASISTTTTAAATVATTTVTVASNAGIVPGQLVLDVSNPNVTPHYFSNGSNISVKSISGTTVTLQQTAQGSWQWECTTNMPCPASGDQLVFYDQLGFSPRNDYPDPGPQPSTVSTPWPTGTIVTLANIDQAHGTTPNDYQSGAFPFTATDGMGHSIAITEGQQFIWTQVGSSGTQGTLTTLSTATPPSAVIYPANTGASQFGFITGLSCPAPSYGDIESGNDYQNPVGRGAEGYGMANWWEALTGSNPTTTAAIASTLTQVAPISTIFNTNPRWLYDNHF
jgi:hypothetical protein